MANVTLSIDDDVLGRCREYAQRHGISLNALIRTLLERAISATGADASADQELFKLMDDLKADSKGMRWTRDELYDG